MDQKEYLAGRDTLVKALHTAKTVPMIAVWLIKSDKFNVTDPEAAVRMALRIIGQNGEWKRDDAVLQKCFAVTRAMLAK